MTPAEAASILELTAESTPEQIEVRFREIRARLEDKIAKAPTPGLKEKYRNALDEATQAFETLTLASDASTLPSLGRAGPAREQRVAPVSPPPPKQGSQRPRRGGWEFFAVICVAVVLFAAGGWWLSQRRSQQQEDELSRTRAQSADAEAASTAAAQVAEAKTRWQALELEQQRAERRLADLRSDLRMARGVPPAEIAAMQGQFDAESRYVDWLQPYLAQHAFRTALARMEAYISTKAFQNADATSREMFEALSAAEKEVPTRRKELTTTAAEVQIVTAPANLSFEVVDAYGRNRQGKTPAKLDLPWGAATVRVLPPGDGWAVQTKEIRVTPESERVLEFKFPVARVKIQSDPADLPFELSGSKGSFSLQGKTPAELVVPPGEYVVRQTREGWPEASRSVELAEDKTATVSAAFPTGGMEIASEPSGLDVTVQGAFGFSRTLRTPGSLTDIPVGTYEVRYSAQGWPTHTQTVEVSAGKIAPVNYQQVGGTVTFTSKPTGATVSIAGRTLGRTPLRLDRLPPGRRTYVFAAENHASANLTYEAEAGQVDERHVELRSTAPGQITVYRPHNLLDGRAATFYVWIDDQPVGELANGTYFAVNSPPGKHQLMIALRADGSGFTKRLDFELEPSGSNFFMTTFVSNFTTHDSKLEQKDPTAAAAEMKGLGRVNAYR